MYVIILCDIILYVCYMLYDNYTPHVFSVFIHCTYIQWDFVYLTLFAPCKACQINQVLMNQVSD